MADIDLTLEVTKVTDESTPLRDNTFRRSKLYAFYLGKFGPFTERVPAEPFDPTEFPRRVELLRQHLRAINT